MPMEAFHNCFGPSVGQSVAQCFSFEIPFKSGPRHRGQSFARHRDGLSRQASSTGKAKLLVKDSTWAELSRCREMSTAGQPSAAIRGAERLHSVPSVPLW